VSTAGAWPQAGPPTGLLTTRLLYARLTSFWHWLAPVGVLVLAAGLNVVGLEREAFANTYYAATVKSMLTGWRAFFFGAFDAGGFITVDKPPVGLWIQAASAKLFGFAGLSLLLPQAIAGVASVGLVFWLVRRAYGTAAGLLAGLALAVTPIAVVTNRNNTMDSQLVLVLLLAAGATTLATERGRLRFLILGAALVGVGYNIKMLQAYLALPALWSMYLAWAPLRLRTRLLHLTAATVVLLAVSLSWSVVVDLTPAADRPYIGSSGSNSALSLALGYNGLGRVTEALASRLPIPGLDGLTVDLTAAPGFAPGIGNPGPLRLLGNGLADQASWLLPLAILGLLIAAWLLLPRPVGPARPALSPPDRERHQRQRTALVLWGLWLAACLAYFSFARFYHIYYLIMLGPPVAALAGVGVSAGWQAYRRGGLAGWVLPLGLLVTAIVQARILLPYPLWGVWLIPPVVGIAFLSAIVLLVRRKEGASRAAPVAAGVACFVLLAAPTVWSVVSVQNNNGAAWLPQAGPSLGFGGRGPGGARFGVAPSLWPAGWLQGGGGPGGPFGPGRAPDGQGGGPGGFGGGQRAMTFAGDQWDSLDPRLVQYLLANQGGSTFLVATPTSSYASLFMLMTDQPAMALGGYQGWDRVLTPVRLAALVREGPVRYFYINAGPGTDTIPGGIDGWGSSQDATVDLLAWVRTSCTLVTPDLWGAESGRRGGQDQRGQQLYDCGAPATSASG
jgi:4-amino-4-deoxy-L-arabinose transferase-like glycosyltransferase